MKLKNITCTCHACPTQYEGQLKNGKHVYFRFRHGYGRIDVDGTTIHTFTGINGEDGVLPEDRVKQEFKKANIKGFKKATWH